MPFLDPYNVQGHPRSVSVNCIDSDLFPNWVRLFARDCLRDPTLRLI